MSDRGADGTVYFEDFWGDPEERGFGEVGISGEASEKDGAGTRDIGDAVRDETTGARFCDRERCVFFKQELDEASFERF